MPEGELRNDDAKDDSLQGPARLDGRDFRKPCVVGAGDAVP